MRSFAIRLLFAAGTLLLLGAVGYAQAPRATITFDNKSGEPAVVKLIGPTGRIAQVSNGQTRTVTVSGGRYYIVTRYGASHHTYSKGDPFTVTQTATQYSRIS